MKITILGSGSAYGVPMAFNVWGAAHPNNPKNKRSRASLLIEDKGKAILVDAGPDFRYLINDNNVANIDAVFITHGHYDHIAGIPELPRATKTLEHGITVFATAETMAELKQSYGYLFKDKADAEPDSKSVTWQVLPDAGEFVAEGLSFKTILFQHHHIHSSAFRYQNFAYVTDWQALPDNCGEFLSGLELLVIECNNADKPEENGHSDIFKVQEVIEKFQPKRVVLSHISRRMDADDFSKKLPNSVELSYDGMVLTL
jgi:phosphoribosyl 1,2-cyclic phosphate phosphodiesterase